MNIALDYDNTYTRDPQAWDVFIMMFRSRGHKVFLVTCRDADNYKKVKEVIVALNNKTDGIFFTSDKAKDLFMIQKDILIDVWIDDTPLHILEDVK